MRQHSHNIATTTRHTRDTHRIHTRQPSHNQAADTVHTNFIPPDPFRRNPLYLLDLRPKGSPAGPARALRPALPGQADFIIQHSSFFIPPSRGLHGCRPLVQWAYAEAVVGSSARQPPGLRGDILCRSGEGRPAILAFPHPRRAPRGAGTEPADRLWLRSDCPRTFAIF
jgi:hypothetical protein